MKCAKHPEHEAEGTCSYSGKPYCSHELVEVDGRYYARDNIGKVIAEAKEHGKPMVFMNAGGASSSSSSAAAAGGIRPFKPPVSHGFHLVMTILTCGLWIPIWIWRAWRR